jgi:hypothetical protein
MSIDSREDIDLARAKSWLPRLETTEVQCCAGLLQSFPMTALRIKGLMRGEQGRSKTNRISYRPSDLSRLAPVYQHTKVSRLGPRKRMGLFFSGSPWRIKIRCAQEKVVRLWIDLHRLCSVLGLYRLDLTELVG